MPEDRIIQAAARIRLVLMDVDGVLTDGTIHLTPLPDGSAIETKVFDVTDGAGIALLHRAGIRTGFVTRRKSAAVAYRAKELSVEFCYNGEQDKAAALDEILAESGVGAHETCFIGDDLHDLPVLLRVGFPAAPASARPEVRSYVLFTTEAAGGRGAVRELCELILRAQHRWDSIVDSFLPR